YFPHTQLSFASLCGFRRIIEHLAEKGHAINEVDRYERAAIDYSALSGRSNTQLAKALIPGSLQIPDNLGRTAMHWAATHNHEAILKVLLASGARANSRCGSGETPLLKAVKGRYLGMARFLLGRGADANLTDTRGSTPLWWA
ncbi:ankyrin repeat-containing domain protein, partial [Schizothecium vesticola]